MFATFSGTARCFKFQARLVGLVQCIYHGTRVTIIKDCRLQLCSEFNAKDTYAQTWRGAKLVMVPCTSRSFSLPTDGSGFTSSDTAARVDATEAGEKVDTSEALTMNRAPAKIPRYVHLQGSRWDT